MTEEISALIVRENRDGIATLVLNRPEKRNAISIRLLQALEAELDDIASSQDQIGLVILRANGPEFCAGADLAEKDRQPRKNFQAKVIEKLAQLPQPVVVAVRGKCFTGGLELALGGDFIVADETAQFADTHGKWGLVPGWGMSQRLPRRIGQAKTREMMFTGRLYSADEALQMGLVASVFASDRFDAELEAMAQMIVQNSWHSLRGNKRLLNETDGMRLAEGLAHEVYNSPGKAPDVARRIGVQFNKKSA